MMYVETIIDGIDEIPEIEAAQLVEMRNFFEKKSTKELFQILLEKDKKYADFLLNKDASTNRQKVTRALEVVGATGKSIMDFWGNKRKLFNDFQFEKYITSLDMKKSTKGLTKCWLKALWKKLKRFMKKPKKTIMKKLKKRSQKL